MNLRTLIAVVVLFVWALSFTADIFVPGYAPSPYLHAVMMAVVGGVVGDNVLRKGARALDAAKRELEKEEEPTTDAR